MKPYIHLISGPMFSGKSEQLIKKHQQVVGIYPEAKIVVLKPAADSRDENISSRVGTNLKCKLFTSSNEILELVSDDTDFVFIDEVQFADENFVNVVTKLRDEKGITVFLSGLDLLFDKREFPVYTQLNKIADYKTKTAAVCVKCGDVALYSKRTSGGSSDVAIEGEAEYIAVCLKHHGEE